MPHKRNRKRQRPDSPPKDSDEEGFKPIGAEKQAFKKTRRKKARRKATAKPAAAVAAEDDVVVVVYKSEDEDEVEDLSAEDQEMVLKKYFRPYRLPLMTREEDRKMFDTTAPDMRARPAPSFDLSPLTPEEQRMCTICLASDHAAKQCPELTVTPLPLMIPLRC
jgi:hypothetical protein